MNIHEIIKTHHHMMIDKGFHECPVCEGSAKETPDGRFCDCLGTGINTTPDHITELIAPIVGELLGEALEAHRCGRFYKKDEYSDDYLDQLIITFSDGSIAPRYFEETIKNTFGDELADFYLRIFDLCGLLDLNPEPGIMNGTIFDGSENIAVSLFEFNKYLVDIERTIIVSKNLPAAEDEISEMIYAMDRFCSVHDIPIEKHIRAKMAYNRTRPHKHGKDY